MTKPRKTNTRAKTSRTSRKKPTVFGLQAIHIHLSIGTVIIMSALVAWTLSTRQQTTYAGPPSAPAGKTWNLMWSDEFSGTSVDTSKWNVQNNTNFGASNNEDECYMANNVSVAAGTLRLTAQQQTVTCGGTNPDTGNSTYYFTSGMITTRAQQGSMKFKFNKGYAEARVKAPRGNPYWPAFWLVSPNDGSTPGWPDYGEFDIFELYGARPDITTGSLHYKCTKAGNHCQLAPTWYNIKTDSAYGGTSTLGTAVDSTQNQSYIGATNNFVTYGFLWEGDKITWYVNGRKTRYFDGTSLYRIEQNGSQTLEGTTATLGTPSIPFSTVFGYDHSIILNLAVGGNGPRYTYYNYTGYDTASGYVNGNLLADLPGTMEVDYVRVYQLGDTPPVSTPPPTTTTPSTNTSTNTNTTAPTPTNNSSPSSSNTQTTVVPESGAVVNGEATLTPGLDSDPALQAKIAKVEYYMQGKLVRTLTEPPFTFDTTGLKDGTYVLSEKVYYKDGTTSEKSAPITIKNTANTSQKPLHKQPWIYGITLSVATLGSLFVIPSTRIWLLRPVQTLRGLIIANRWK